MHWFYAKLHNSGLFILFLYLFLLSACTTTTPPIAPVAAATSTTTVPPSTASYTPAAAATSTPTSIPTSTSTSTPNSTSTSSPTFTITPTPKPPTPTLTPTLTPTIPPLPTYTSPPQPTSVPTVATIAISEIASQAGNEITITGQVIATASFSGGYKFTLSDGTGQVVLLLWNNIYDACWDAPTLNLGATATATGTVGQFEGEWQIEPDFGGDVKVLTAGGIPPEQAIGTLGNYMGQRVTIIGQISRVEGTSSGAKLFVADATGEILVFVWNNTLNRIPNNVPLGVPGTAVRVVGYVQEFRSNREIIPVLPYDVVVLP